LAKLLFEKQDKNQMGFFRLSAKRGKLPRAVKIFICTDFQIKTTALTATAAKPAQAAAAPGPHDTSALP